MAKKSTPKNSLDKIIYAPIEYQPITQTIEKNYMPYVMSVIVSRAIPEIDGLKPSHRKLLYTMYKMGLLTSNRTKSANVVGQTMKLNPHGDASIYETLVRLTRGNETLNHPLIDSKGSFGKQYSSNMRYAASRYTEIKLDSICTELFRGIDKNAVNFIDNYDNTMKEPMLLPTTFPNILVMPSMGIAVGMASNICSFNLAEICDGTIALLKNPRTGIDKLLEIIKAPDFPGGGTIIYDLEQMKQIYETGSGSVKIRARYNYDKDANCIDIIQIPYSTSIELIMNKISDLVKDNKLKEISDFRDEIDLNGFKLTLDLKKGIDPNKLMAKLYKITPLEDSFKCNFNILIDSIPRQMGVIEILNEWIKFRISCVHRELAYDLQKKQEKLHLLLGLGKILLDIDKAISIIRNTEHETDVIPNLSKGFSIDEVQADYVADIKLRNINREYILNRIKEIESLQEEIAKIEEILADELKIKALIAKQLIDVKKKFGIPRKSYIVDSDEIEEYKEEDDIENFKVRILLTSEGYFKKITLLSLRGNDEQKLKDGDTVAFDIETDNLAEIIFFTDKGQVYKSKVCDFENIKASLLGDFLPAKLNMDTDEKPIFMCISNELKEDDNFVFIFENGKGVRVPVTAYETKSNRKKLTSAYSIASPIVNIFHEREPFEIMMISNVSRAIVVKSTIIPQKATRSAMGVAIMVLKKGQKVSSAISNFESKFENTKGYKKIKIPATGTPLAEKDIDFLQIKIDI